MSKKIINDVGEEEEVYTPEEVAAFTAERDAAKREAEEAREHLKKKTDEFVQAKQGFKKFEEYTEEEKAKMTAREQEYMQRLEKQEETVRQERETAKEAFFSAAAKGDEKVLAKMKEKYALVQMPEGTTEEIRTRINAVLPWAYADLGIVERATPIENTIISGGDVPRSKDSGKRFADTAEGKDKAKAIFGELLEKKI